MVTPPQEAKESALLNLASALGISPSYQGYDGTPIYTSLETYEALIWSMGCDISSPSAIRNSLESLGQTRQAEWIAPTQVSTASEDGAAKLRITIPEQPTHRADWELLLVQEDGQSHSAQGTLFQDGPRHYIPLPATFEKPLGYHEITLRIALKGQTHERKQRLIICPEQCVRVGDILQDKRGWGFWSHFYSVRSDDGFGMGDFHDLDALLERSAKAGACFFGIQPLHAVMDTGFPHNPYFPSSRLFRSPLYIDVGAVPEFSSCPAAQTYLSSNEAITELDSLRHASELDYSRVWRLKQRVLRLLYREFCNHHLSDATARGKSFLDFAKRHGKALKDFAAFSVLFERLPSSGLGKIGFHEWPEPYRDPASAQVQAFSETHQNDIRFQMFLQFEMDRQLEQLQRKATDRGMALGLYHDLALGNAPGGSDTWSYQELFAHKASVGAPPDPFSATGQTWNLCPLLPHKLAHNRFDYWTDLLRAACKHAGALRIDHVMGVTRQFWVPTGRSAKEGAYVHYPEQNLLGILALESHRHRCVIIGEDLGVVPEHLRDVMNAKNILRSEVFYFKRDRDGSFSDSSTYAPASLVTANTHDLPTIVGYWQGRDLEVRKESTHAQDLRLITALRTERERDVQLLLEHLRRSGLVDAHWHPTHAAELIPHIHEFLAKTPCVLLGISLDDLAAELDAINVPSSAHPEQHNWTRRMTTSRDSIPMWSIGR